MSVVVIRNDDDLAGLGKRCRSSVAAITGDSLQTYIALLNEGRSPAYAVLKASLSTFSAEQSSSRAETLVTGELAKKERLESCTANHAGHAPGPLGAIRCGRRRHRGRASCSQLAPRCLSLAGRLGGRRRRCAGGRRVSQGGGGVETPQCPWPQGEQ